MKKFYLIFIALLLTVIVGCGRNEQAPQEAPAEQSEANVPIELNMFHSWSADTERGAALAAAVTEFNNQYEGRYHVVLTINPDFPTYQEVVRAMIAANETPDIFHYNFNPNDLARQRSGRLMDFTPHMDSEWRARFYEADLDLLTVDGQLTSIPFEQAGALMYINPELFAEAGIHEFPDTWEGLITAFGQLDANGVNGISLFTSDDAWHTTGLLTYLWASTAGSVVANGSDVNTPEMVRAVENLRRIFNYTTGDAVGANYPVSMNNFASGRTAMVVDGPWLIGMLPEELTQTALIVPAPTFGDGRITPGFIVTDSQTPWAAAAQSDPAREEAVVTFMRFITSEDVAKRLMLDGSVFLSLRINLTEQELDEIAIENRLLANYIDVFLQAQESVVNMQRNLTSVANSRLPSLIESLVLDQITPQQFVEELHSLNQ